jgi:phosphotransferase system HPr (HPr) family protein
VTTNAKLTRKVTIQNRLGMHARPAAMISKLAQKAEKGVWIGIGNTMAEASSIIDILSIGCRQGTQVMVAVESENDIAILESIKELIEGGFGEDQDE